MPDTPEISQEAARVVATPADITLARAIKAELTRLGITDMRQQAETVLEAARAVLLDMEQEARRWASYDDREGAWFGALADRLDDAESALLRVVDDFPSAAGLDALAEAGMSGEARAREAQEWGL